MSKLSFSVLKIWDFRLLVLTRIFTHMALNCQAVIVGWQIYSLTKSEFMLGLTGLAEAVPAIIAALFSGHIVDTSSPQKIFILSLAALTLNTFMLLLVGGGHLSLDDNHIIAMIFVGIFISGLARSFIMPSTFAILPQTVERMDYSAAAAWLNTAFQFAVIIAPALAGMAYGFSGPAGAWIFPTAFLALSLLCSLNFRNLRPYVRPEQKEAAIKSIKAGWRFILDNPLILSIMAVDMMAVLFGGAVAMLPAYADQILHVGPEGLGLLRSATAIGAIVTALYFSIYPMKKFSLNRLLIVAGGFGACMIGFGLSTSFLLSMFFLALSGAFDSISVIIRSTIKQILTPDAMRGRVSSVNSMFVISSNEIGAFESGTAARLMGLVPSVVFGGVMTLIIVGTTTLLTPRLRKIVIDDTTSPGG